MKVEITVFYPWPGIENDKVTVEMSDDIPDWEKDNICFDYAIDAIFDRGVSWDYKEVK